MASHAIHIRPSSQAGLCPIHSGLRFNGKRVRDKEFFNSRGFSTYEEYKLRFRERYLHRFFQLLERHGFKNKGVRANPHSFINLDVGSFR